MTTLKDEISFTLDFLARTDIILYGFVTKETLNVCKVQNYELSDKYKSKIDPRLSGPKDGDIILVAASSFKSVFGQFIRKGERLQLIPGEYSHKLCKRFVRIDERSSTQLSVTMHNEDIINFLKSI